MDPTCDSALGPKPGEKGSQVGVSSELAEGISVPSAAATPASVGPRQTADLQDAGSSERTAARQTSIDLDCFWGKLSSIQQSLVKIEAEVTVLTKQRTAKDFYGTKELGGNPRKSRVYRPRMVSEWSHPSCKKKGSGRGSHQAWAVSHEELARYQREGLLPISR